MKTATINNISLPISYRTSTDMYTRRIHPSTGKAAQYGADIYEFDDLYSHIVIVVTSHNGSTLKATTKLITAERYSQLADMHDACNAYPYHNAILDELGFYSPDEA